MIAGAILKVRRYNGRFQGEIKPKLKNNIYNYNA